MKTILCYGDSNTWGFNASTKSRFPHDVRWTGILRNELGQGYWIIEEGLNGRTTVWDDSIEGEWKNGLRYLMPCLESHAPLDLVVIMLGTNDLKLRYSVPASDIARGLKRLASLVLTSSFGVEDRPPKLLLIAPPLPGKLTEFADMFTGSQEKATRLGFYYQQVAELFGSHFLDASQVIQSSGEDGIHLSAEDHKKLGQAIAKVVKQIV